MQRTAAKTAASRKRKRERRRNRRLNSVMSLERAKEIVAYVEAREGQFIKARILRRYNKARGVVAKRARVAEAA